MRAPTTDDRLESTTPVRIELFIQAHAAAATVKPLRDLVARARRLEDAIDAAVHVETWTTVRPALEEVSDSGVSISETVETFRSWAGRHGYDLEPGFGWRETTSIVGQQAAEVRVPTACVAVYADGSLQCVAPCADGDRVYTVSDCLAKLEDGITEPFGTRNERPPDSSEGDGPRERYARPEEQE